VAGKALALLCVYAGIRQIYAEVLSRKAKGIFEDNKIMFEWKEIIDNILYMTKQVFAPSKKSPPTSPTQKNLMLHSKRY
jgi:hypothetical protein